MWAALSGLAGVVCGHGIVMYFLGRQEPRDKGIQHYGIACAVGGFAVVALSTVAMAMRWGY